MTQKKEIQKLFKKSEVILKSFSCEIKRGVRGGWRWGGAPKHTLIP